MTTCTKCRRPLTDPLSISLGMGPTCRGGLRRGRPQRKDEFTQDIFGSEPTMRDNSLARLFDSCGECRLEIGGTNKYRTLTSDQIVEVVDALELVARMKEPGQIMPMQQELKSTRPVMILERMFDADKSEDTARDSQAGDFHGFFQAGLYIDGRGKNNPVAVVELPDGSVKAVDCEMIRFLDRQA